MIWVQLTVAGIASGAIYALAGMGLVLTYKATGIFNFAHGAIAVFVAYMFWQLRDQWHVPLVISALLALLVVGPGCGLFLERVVFRPLERKGASTSEKLVATLGAFLLFLGITFAVWTGKVRQGTRLVSGHPIQLGGGVVLGYDQIFVIVLVVVVSALLYLLFNNTHLGTEIRAVVDRRELSELASIDANRIAGISWALGAGMAGATGVLLASGNPLDPFHFTLLVIEVFSIAVVARLVSLPIVVAAGVLLLGVASSLLSRVELTHIWLTHIKAPRGVTEAFNAFKGADLAVVILFAALLLYRNLDEVGASGTARGLVSGAVGRRTGRGAARLVLIIAAVGIGIGILMPFFLNDINIKYAQITIGLAVVFVSIVCVTGFSGHITLGQAGFAGMGAFVAARVANGFGLPVVLSILVGGLGAMVVGLVAGYPALKRRGLFLGLTTLAINLLASTFIFESNTFAGGAGGLTVHRPSLFGWSFESDHAFYWFELVVLWLMLMLARNLRSGRLGRVLGAMRDSETATSSVGIDLRAYKLFIFAVSAFIAGVGGALLAEQARVFGSGNFDVFASLRWFVVVIFAGVWSLAGAVIGAVLFEMLGPVFHAGRFADAIVAMGALLIAYIPGGSLMGWLQLIGRWVQTPRGLIRYFAEARQERLAPPPAVPAPGTNGVVPSAFAERILQEASPR